MALSEQLNQHLWLVGEDSQVKCIVSLVVGLQIGIGTIFYQIECNLVVAQDSCELKRRHAVHEGLHEVLFVDVLVLFFFGFFLFVFFHQFAAVEIHLGTTFNKSFASFKVASFHRSEQRGLPIVVEDVDFGTESALRPALLVCQDSYHAAHLFLCYLLCLWLTILRLLLLIIVIISLHINFYSLKQRRSARIISNLNGRVDIHSMLQHDL